MVKEIYTKEAWDSVDLTTNAGLVDSSRHVPLFASAGRLWNGRSTDVLGRVIEVVTGKPLAQAFD